MDCMVDSKENYKFDLGAKGLKSHVCFKMHRNCEEKQIIDHQLKLKGKKKKKKKFIIGKRVNIFPTCVDQTFSALSKDPDAMYLPSGLNDRECTAS